MNLNKILVIDDNEDDHFFFERAFKNCGIKAQLIKAYNQESCDCALQDHEFDCIFLDYVLPGVDGLDLLKRIRSMNIKAPVIMLTGQKSEQMIVQFIQQGAVDYIQKDNLNAETLRISIENAIRLDKIQKQKKTAEDALRKSEARLGEAQKIAHIGNWEFNFKTKSIYLSQELKRILGYKISYIPSFTELNNLIHQEDKLTLQNCIERINIEPYYDINFRVYIGKELKFLNGKSRLVTDGDGQPHALVGTIQDITQLNNAIAGMNKEKAGKKAKSIVITIALTLFILSEAILDPFIDAISTSIILALSFKGGIALFLKPLETFLERVMVKR